MKTKYIYKYISLPIIMVLLMSGIFPVGVHHASANGEPYIMANPRFEVRPNIDQVRGWDWTVGDTLTLQVGGRAYTGKVGVTDWDPNQSYIEFNLAGIYDIQPGDYVSLSNGTITKDTTVSELELTEVNIILDTVSGKAAPETNIDLWVCNTTDWVNFYRHVTADTNGNWIANFSTPGDLSDEQNTFNIVPGIWVDSQQVDENEDATMSGATVRNPNFVVNPTGHWAYAWDWPADQDLTLSVGEFSKTVTNHSTGPFTSEAYFDLSDLELNPGDEVTVSGAGIDKTLVITGFTVDLDVLNNTLSGTASPRGGVFACADNAPGNCRFATSDENGDWSMSPDPEGFVLAPGVFGWAAEGDEDGDMTRMDWRVLNPRFDVHANTDEVEALEWPIGETLTLKVNGETVATQEVVNTADWDPITTYVYFYLAGIYNIQPGDYVSLTDGTVTKDTTVSQVEITDINVVMDTLSGKAIPNSSVDSWVWNGVTEFHRHVVADDDGLWSADFSKVGSGQDEQSTIDISPGTWVYAKQVDEDGDSTMFGQPVPNPRFDVRANADQVQGWEWTVGEMLTLSVGGQEYTGKVGVAPWDPNQSYIEFNLAGIYDIQPGDYVSLSDASITKDTTVTDLDLSEVNIVLDTVGGKAATDSEVLLWAWDGSTNYYRTVTAYGDNVWSADFSGSDGQDPFDIEPGTWVDSQQVDEDGDATMSGATVRNPIFVVNPTGHWAYVWDWPADQNLTLSVGNFEETVKNHPTGPFTSEAYFDLIDVDLNVGEVVSVSGAGIEKTLGITDFTVELNVLNDTLTGTASPWGGVFACADNAPGNCRFATADENGIWSMSPDPQGFVLAPGVFGWAAEGDEDGDMTRMDWWAPMPTSGSAIGEGWFASPAGAYTVDPVLAGKAVIQFDAKYSKKTATLSGSVQFSFKRFSFASTSLEWLVIDGERMQLSGQGKINGKAGYSFMLSAAKDSPEVNGNDTVHIRIWETASGNVLYDNMPGVPDYVVPTTLLQGGEIILTQ